MLNRPDQQPFEFRMTAADHLWLRIQTHLEFEPHPEGFSEKIEEHDFKEYGETVDGEFIPYWRDAENFDQFTQRETGLNQPKDIIVGDAVKLLLVETKIPMSAEAREALSGLDQLFSLDQIDLLHSYAIQIPDEFIYAFTLGLESAGIITPGSVEKVTSPLLGLREAAYHESCEFNEHIRLAADAVEGWPKYDKPEQSPEVVQQTREVGVLPQEPEMTFQTELEHYVFASTVRGEAASHVGSSPIRAIQEELKLLVLSEKANVALVDKLLTFPHLLRYLLAEKIVLAQRQRMKEFEYMCKKLRHRKWMDAHDEHPWPYKSPARKNPAR